MGGRINNESKPNEESVARPAAQARAAIIQDEEAYRASLHLYLLSHHRIVDEVALANAEAASQDSNSSLLEVLVEQRKLTLDEKRAVESMASLVVKRMLVSELPAVDLHHFSERGEAAESISSSTENDDQRAENTSPEKDKEEAHTLGSFDGSTFVKSSPGSLALSERKFGDYEIVEEVARGGMGIVYKARQISLNRIVALKKIRAGQLASGEEMKRFQLEAEAAAQLDHPGIVPVYDFGEVDGQPFFSMGLVEGQSLADRIQNGPLQPRDAAELLIKVSQAIAYANENGIVHRDLKPSNVLIDQNGEPRVTDFGLAKHQAIDSGVTSTGQVLGTPSYMPPEQAAGNSEKVDQRADVYALGANLYTTLTGRPPLQAATVVETINQVLNQEPVSVKQLVPTVPRDLETICLKALRKEADKRYDNAYELAKDLQRWLGGEPIRARRVSRVEKTMKWCKRKPLVVGSIATIIAMLVIGSLIFWEQRNATYVNGLINSLVNADADQVSPLVDELNEYAWWAEPRLRERLVSVRTGTAEELHLSLALMARDPDRAESLLDALLTTPESEYVGVIRDALLRSDAPIEEKCWSTLRNKEMRDSERFRAAIVLAGVAPSSDQWIESDYLLLVNHLAEINAVYQPLYWPLLINLEKQLLPKLEALFNDRNRSESEQIAAANAIAYFAEKDTTRLVRLLGTANGPQYRKKNQNS